MVTIYCIRSTVEELGNHHTETASEALRIELFLKLVARQLLGENALRFNSVMILPGLV